LSLWRAIRRRAGAAASADSKSLLDVRSPVGAALVQAADEGDYAAFLRMLGGLSPSRGYWTSAQTDTVFNRYGEATSRTVRLAVFSAEDNGTDPRTAVVVVTVWEPGRFDLVSDDDPRIAVPAAEE
jgi:hypothetical protein